uniref:Uncharacterized protein n=1 Tax=Oryza nivara TaxID=4536 RepID=A0A0E0J4F2_ORYNI
SDQRPHTAGHQRPHTRDQRPVTRDLVVEAENRREEKLIYQSGLILVEAEQEGSGTVTKNLHVLPDHLLKSVTKLPGTGLEDQLKQESLATGSQKGRIVKLLNCQ